MKKTENFTILLCNIPNIENAKLIAYNLIKEKLAACVNIIPNVISVYEWKDRIEEENEVTILIKSQSSLLDEVELNILKSHPYEIPEIIQLDVSSSNEDYYNWLLGALKK